MGQKICNMGPCCYCHSQTKGVFYKGMYPQDEELLEVHCNTCRASWNPDGTLRSIPSEEKLERLGVLSLAYDNGLPVATDPSGEWNSINQEEFYNEVKVSI